ncbi:MAG: hypothetical protein PHV98_00865 [Candidatus Omnitrophica bacterium]|nr:hypothetical protein [Candidatus Omnitrophota bacterium]
MPYQIGDPHAALAVAILRQAVDDWKKNRKKPNEFLNFVGFFNSDCFEDLCDIVGINPSVARSKLKIAETKIFSKQHNKNYREMLEEIKMRP